VSKIEDALRKARLGGKNLSASPASKSSIANNPVVSSTGNTIIKKSSSSLIKLMKSDATINDEDLINKGIILPVAGNSKVTDSFRYLRTQLLQKSKNENFIVLVTSCFDGFDSAFVTMNMAAAFSFDDSKTSLVIDCDINSNKIDEMLGIEFDSGLMDFLGGDVNVAEILKDIGIRRLRIIASGKKEQPDTESESFTSVRMKVLLDGLVERYHDRFVILNSPPLSEQADVSILSDLVDYIVLVVPYGGVTAGDLEDALSKIDKSKLLGVVFNDVPSWS